MPKYTAPDLEPTEENIKNNLLTDPYKRKFNIEDLLNLFSEIKPPFALALNGPWGAGKTFLIKSCKYIIDNINTHSTDLAEYINSLNLTNKDYFNHVNTLYFDAWKNDDQEDPLVALLGTLLLKNGKSSNSKLAHLVIGTLLSISKSAIANKTGIDIDGMRQEVKDIGGLGKDYLANLQKIEELNNKIEELINNLIPENGKLIIFIDELDRCKPSFAIDLLERIKHYLRLPNVIFIFTVNISELSATVKQVYGSDYNGGEYLNRFFDDIQEIPHISLKTYSLVNLNKDDRITKNLLEKVDTQFHLTPRQLNHFKDKLSRMNNEFKFKSMYNMSNVEYSAVRMLMMIVVFYLLALEQTNPVEYKKYTYKNKDLNDSEFIKFVKKTSLIDQNMIDLLSEKLLPNEYEISTSMNITEFSSQIFNNLFSNEVSTNTAYSEQKEIWREFSEKIIDLVEHN